MAPIVPTSLHLDKDQGLSVEWSDGAKSFYSIGLLRRLSPSADMRDLRDRMASNPLTVLPASGARDSSPGTLRALGAEMVGHYAVRIRFSDGHSTGIYSWEYLRSIDPKG